MNKIEQEFNAELLTLVIKYRALLGGVSASATIIGAGIALALDAGVDQETIITSARRSLELYSQWKAGMS